MKCAILLLFFSGWFCLTGCVSSTECESSFNDLLLERINASPNLSKEYRQAELKRKEKLILKVCSKLEGQSRLLIIEQSADKRYGLIHTYENQSTYTYQQDTEMLVMSKGYRYDKLGNLEALFLSIKDSVVEKLTQKVEQSRSRQKFDDVYPIRIFYIDLKKNSCNYFLLD